MVAVVGFEPTTPVAQGQCATKLRYTEIIKIITQSNIGFSNVTKCYRNFVTLTSSKWRGIPDLNR